MLNGLMKNLSESYHKQSTLMETDMREFFLFIHDEFLSYKEVKLLTSNQIASKQNGRR